MKKLLAAACCAALLTMSMGTVCFAADTAETAQEETAAKVKKVLGEKTEDALKARLTNGTGKDIREFQIKEDSAEEFSENLLSEDEVLAQGEVGVLYYTPEETATEETVYVLRLTFEDDTTAELHAFSFAEIKKARIRLEEDIAYLVYKDGEEKISTLEAEQELAAAAAEPAEEPAAETTSDDGGLQVYEEYYEDTDSGYDSSSGGDTSYSEPAPEPADTGTVDNSTASEPAPAPEGDGGAAAEENCLVGGLLN